MKKLLGFSLLVVICSGCYNDNREELYPSTLCDTSNTTFAATIQPILQQNCALSNCHATGSALGVYVLDTYTGVAQATNNNRLLGAIKHESGFASMPKNMPKLSSCDIMKIERWVNKGAQNN